MSEKLKTLEDIEYLSGSLTGFEPGTKSVFSKKLRIEAIKDVKMFREKKITTHYRGLSNLNVLIDYIMWKNNLTESDLK